MRFPSYILLAFAIFSFAPLQLPAISSQADIPMAKASLKPLEPQWATKVVEAFPEGGVSEVILCDRLQDDKGVVQEIAVKSISYYPDGSLLEEADLQELPVDNHLVRHGSAVSYYQEGTVRSISHYIQGKQMEFFSGFIPMINCFTKVATKTM